MIELIGYVSALGICLIVGLVFAMHKGWIGLSAARLAKMRARVDELQNKFDAEARRKSPNVIPVRDKATRIADNAALLAAGAITQADFDAAKAKILAE